MIVYRLHLFVVAILMSIGVSTACATSPDNATLTATANGFREQIEARAHRRLGYGVTVADWATVMQEPRFASFSLTAKGELRSYLLGQPTIIIPMLPWAVGVGPRDPQEKDDPSIPSDPPMNQEGDADGNPTDAVTRHANVDANGVFHHLSEAAPTGCLVIAMPNLLFNRYKSEDGIVKNDDRPAADIKYIIAHETYHCFQPAWANFSTVGRSMFVAEGAAEFVAANLSETTSQYDHIGSYSIYPKKLSDRDYDAAGLFLHLEARGFDMYLVFEKIYSAGPSQDFLKTFLNAIGPDGQVAWAMSEVDDPSLGANWTWKGDDGTGMRLLNRPRRTLNPMAASVSNVERGAVRLYRVPLPENKVVRIAMNGGAGAIRSDYTGEGETVELTKAGEVDVCFGDKCPCNKNQPASTESAHFLHSQTGEALVSVLGVESPGATVSVIVNEAATARLEQSIPCCRSDGPLDARIVGTWEVDIDSYWLFLMSSDAGTRFIPWISPDRVRFYRRGRMTVEIRRDRTFLKRYEGLAWGAVHSEANDTDYLDFELNGEVEGCINFDGRTRTMHNRFLQASVRTDRNGLTTRRADGWSGVRARSQTERELVELVMPLTWGLYFQQDGTLNVAFDGPNEAVFRFLRYRRVR